MAQAAKSQEPSMEEILASIRRIIAEDDSEKPAQRPAEAPGVELNPEADAAPLDAARTIGDSTPRSAPQETPSTGIATGIGALSGTAKASRASTILDLAEPLASSAPRAAAPSLDSSPPAPPEPIDEDALGNEAVSVTRTGAAREGESGGLISTATSAAVDSAFNALAQTVLVHNARTLEDLVREMLRPMLKVWLDDNLPGMVERLVRAEIERVSRGR
jgi:cell pole-organizing protein PopZ